MSNNLKEASAVILDQPERSKTPQFPLPLSARRWEIAQLTDDDIAEMEAAEMRQIVASHLPSDLPLRDDSERLTDRRRLRQLVRIARRTCRRQGY